jgi:hypothetical protein
MVPGFKHSPAPLLGPTPRRLRSSEVVGVHDDDLAAIGRGRVFYPASLLPGEIQSAGLSKRFSLRLLGKVAVMPMDVGEEVPAISSGCPPRPLPPPQQQQGGQGGSSRFAGSLGNPQAGEPACSGIPVADPREEIGCLFCPSFCRSSEVQECYLSACYPAKRYFSTVINRGYCFCPSPTSSGTRSSDD